MKSLIINRFQCDKGRNHLKVVFNKKEVEDSKKFAVCAKGHSYPDTDVSIRLFEWIEILDGVGAHPVLYYFHNHPNVIKVLEHYDNEGVIDAYYMTVPGSDYNLPYIQFQHLWTAGHRER